MTTEEGQASLPDDIHTASSPTEAESVLEFFNWTPIKNDLHWFTHEATIERVRERDDRRLYYITDGDEVIAALMIWCESRVLDSQEAQIRQVAVHPDYRGNGHGERLCRHAEQFAEEFGMTEMIADAAKNEPASAFWRAIGYRDGGTWETDNGREMIRFWKQLIRRST